MTDEPAYVQVLREPIKDLAGEDVTELKFRKPRGGDIMRCGNPVKYMPHDESQDITFDEVKMAKMLATLSGIPLPMIERMDPNDLLECAWGIASFFIPGMRARPKIT